MSAYERGPFRVVQIQPEQPPFPGKTPWQIELSIGGAWVTVMKCDSEAAAVAMVKRCCSKVAMEHVRPASFGTVEDVDWQARAEFLEKVATEEFEMSWSAPHGSEWNELDVNYHDGEVSSRFEFEATEDCSAFWGCIDQAIT